MPRQIIAGEAGSTWTNDGSKVQYQYLCDWVRSCAVCVQFDHQIGPYWPLPTHRSCRCRQSAIYPGATAEPFVDYRAKILELPRTRQSAVMGASNLAMVESGLVRWSDVVTSGRIRSLREVVAIRKLTVDRMVGSGVKRAEAEEAWQAVHTGTHTALEARRQRLVDSILARGYAGSQLKADVGAGVAAKVGIVAPIGPSSPPTTIRTVEEHRTLLARVIRALARRFGVIPRED